MSRRVVILEPGVWIPIDRFFQAIERRLGGDELDHLREVSHDLRLGERPHRGAEIDDPPA